MIKIHWGWIIAIAFIMFYLGLFITAMFAVSKAADEMRTCRICGCTDERDCEGGCYWVEPGLCSQCADEEQYIT